MAHDQPFANFQAATDLTPDWHYLSLQGSATEGVDALLELQSGSSNNSDTPPRSRGGDRPDPDRADDSRNWFAAGAYGMGTVALFRDPYSGLGPDEALRVLERSQLAKRIAWSNRHGNNPGRGNPEFNNFLIPDVGVAPVFEFQMLMSLFVIGIGPVNYWLLKRRGQLPLLLVTVPAAALATSLALFAYGFLSEGVGTRVRARSFTKLNQRSGEAVCWARLSYYAGFAPGEGMRVPADTAVYPILPSSQSRYRFEPPRELLWGATSAKLPQHLSRGWLAARTPTQYQTITARPTTKRIDFQQTADGLVAANRLGVDLIALAVQDEAGNFYLAEQLASGDAATLSPSNKVRSIMAIRTLLAAHEPEFPAGAEMASRPRYSRGYNRELLSQNLMETELSAITSPVIEGWGRRGYVAITSAGIELELGLDSAVEKDSCHVIRGSW